MWKYWHFVICTTYETYEAVQKMHEEFQQVKYQLNAVKEQLILQRIQSDTEKTVMRSIGMRKFL